MTWRLRGTGRILLILWLAIWGSKAPIGAQGQDSLAELLRDFREAYDLGDWEHSAELGLKIEDLRPDRPGHQYNLACVFTRSGDSAKGLHWLRKAVSNGFSNLVLLDGDDDLEPLRKTAGYVEIREQAQRNIREARAELVRRFEAAPPLVVPPPDHDPARPAPLVIALHGYGGEAKGFPMWWQGATAAKGALLVAPQAVQPHPSGGWAWQGVWQTAEILDLTLSYVQQSFAVDQNRIVLTGFSQGGYMAMAVGLLHPQKFAGVVPMAGGFDEARDGPPPPSSGAPRYYFMVGANDQNKNQVLVAARAFEEAGYDVTLQVYPKVGHTFPLSHDKVLARVLEHVLQEQPTP